jgi:D-alanyl-D-alanine carboxypeptidase (penicillin-binding protein 5/6)
LSAPAFSERRIRPRWRTAAGVALLAALLLGAPPGARASAPPGARASAPPGARASAPPGAPTGVDASAPASAPAGAPPRFTASGSCLAEESTGQALYTFAAERELAIASTTKLMTTLVVLQHVRDLNAIYAQNDYRPAPDDSQIGLVPGERMSVRDLLIAMMLPSADDAAEDLAYHVGHGSIPRFIAMMNADARALGLRHTHYATPIGLDTAGNYSTPCDLVKLARFDLQHEPFLRRVVAIKTVTLTSSAGPIHVTNLNTLLFEYPWVNGVKTGYTSEAGYVLVASGTRDGMTLIDAVLGTPSMAARARDALALLDYGFADFRRLEPVRRGELIARVPVSERPGARAAVIAAASLVRVLPRRERLTWRPELPRQLSGPLPRHARVGTLVVLAGGRRLASVPLLLARRLPAVSPLTLAARFLSRPSTLTLLGLALAVLVVLAWWRVTARRRKEEQQTA